MKCISLNLNKRLSLLRHNDLFNQWLEAQHADILLFQETYKSTMDTSDYEDYCYVGGNQDLTVWKRRDCSKVVKVETYDFYQLVQLDYIQLYNVHLDAYKTSHRKRELETLVSVAMRTGRSHIFVGDFNLAPRLEDGVYAGEASKFNNNVDRGAYYTFMTELHLDDMLQTVPPEYTIERYLMGKMSQFRCDLLLASHHLSADVSAHYEHCVRQEYRFTDHSAIVFDVKYSLNTDYYEVAEQQYCPDKTAMNRRHASPMAKLFCNFLQKEKGLMTSILDYGCGYGKDVDYYAMYFDTADGYDPSEKFQRCDVPQRKYQNIALTYVLNVIETPDKRLDIIEAVVDLLELGGYCMVAVRSDVEIESAASKKEWIRHMDGYWSSVTRKTFQKGFTIQYLKSLLESVNGLEIIDVRRRGQHTVYAICRRV